jgi:hypothetical protein
MTSFFSRHDNTHCAVAIYTSGAVLELITVPGGGDEASTKQHNADRQSHILQTYD